MSNRLLGKLKKSKTINELLDLLGETEGQVGEKNNTIQKVESVVSDLANDIISAEEAEKKLRKIIDEGRKRKE